MNFSSIKFQGGSKTVARVPGLYVTLPLVVHTASASQCVELVSDSVHECINCCQQWINQPQSSFEFSDWWISFIKHHCHTLAEDPGGALMVIRRWSGAEPGAPGLGFVTCSSSSSPAYLLTEGVVCSTCYHWGLTAAESRWCMSQYVDWRGRHVAHQYENQFLAEIAPGATSSLKKWLILGS